MNQSSFGQNQARSLTEHPVVLFMKGTPQFPQCGFSNVAAQVLKACGTEFFAVNVLAGCRGLSKTSRITPTGRLSRRFTSTAN